LALAVGNYSYDGGYAAALELARGVGMPDALFCANDLMAIGALDALRYELGLKAPDDVLVAGFDDVPEASWKAYDLTTVLQDSASMVAEAVAVLRKMIASTRSAGGVLRTVPGHLIERATTRREGGPSSPSSNRP